MIYSLRVRVDELDIKVKYNSGERRVYALYSPNTRQVNVIKTKGSQAKNHLVFSLPSSLQTPSRTRKIFASTLYRSRKCRDFSRYAEARDIRACRGGDAAALRTKVKASTRPRRFGRRSAEEASAAAPCRQAGARTGEFRDAAAV